MTASPEATARPERILCVTGRLAERLVRQVVDETLTPAFLDCRVQVVGISVAALMHVSWLKRKLTVPDGTDRVIVPGWCQGELAELTAHFGVPFERGPKEIADLPLYLTGRQRVAPNLSAYDIEILAEINHAPQFAEAEILRRAEAYRAAGADIIDVGAIPGQTWSSMGRTVAALRREGFRVSVDSFDQQEVESAVDAGAELVLSCNRSNLTWAKQLDVAWVVVPDDPHDLSTMDACAEELLTAGRKVRLDPILEPIGFGFGASLLRYDETRRRWPDAQMMMGVGNLTEMTEVDSAGVNMLLAALCQEWKITSVLTTEVANWCRSAVAEFALARRIVKHAVEQQTVPKRLDPDLVLLREARLNLLGERSLADLAQQLQDPNYRIFVEREEIHIMNRDGHWRGTDPYQLFDEFSQAGRPLEAGHAFYLGHELCKAATALQLGKQYRQDEALRWGLLTQPEISARARRHREEGTDAS